MTNNTKCFAVVFGFILSISGCATVGTFQKMSSNERADYVCSRDNDYNTFSDSESHFSSKMHDVSETLSKGYRVHKSCRNVKVEKPGTVSCTTHGTGAYRYTDCTQDTITTYEKVCTETPVSIDANLERENLEKYKELWVRAMTEKYAAYRRCYSLVQPMSAEQAFRYYESR